MVNKKDNNDFIPTVAIAPGETIKENMEFLGMNQKELAARLGITPKHLTNIINGIASITYETALKLESVIGPGAQFWMNLEANYQLNKARLKEQEKLDNDLEILKSIPYKEMNKFGWVEETADRKKRVFNCRNFFGVAELSSIRSSYGVAYRKHKQVREISDYGVLAWLRKAELDGLNIEVKNFNKVKLKNLIPTFRGLTQKDSEDFYPKIVRLCAECGVALVLVPYLPKTYICGATIWRNNKAILALSVRGKKADIFWFTFFHELAHLINHSRKEFHISYERKDEEAEENEADIEASNYLISEVQYNKFIKEYNYEDKTEIVNYSEEIGVAPCILLGRLQYDGYLGYQYYNELRPTFEIVAKNNI
jgi:HTH-type transcriptional regulator/antitoxin HigA